VFRKRHEATYDAPITQVYSELLEMLARSRWGATSLLAETDRSPRVGQAYVQRRGSVVRRGRVVECLRPVIVTLYESLFDAPCRVRLRLGWRLEPQNDGSLLLLDASYELNGPAYLNRRHWAKEIDAHCGKLMKAMAVRLEDEQSRHGAESGQKTGSKSITVTNTMAVSGNPNFK
jgi:hypothetical protein